MRRNKRQSTEPAPEPPAHDTEVAWKALSLVVDWIRHAEAKAAATLATTGLAAGVLYNVTKDLKAWSRPVSAAVVVCVLLLLVAGISAGVALRPRLRNKNETPSTIYYRDISAAHPKSSGASAYVAQLQDLIADKQRLVAEVAGQVWANAHVAKQKFTWTAVAINALLWGLLVLGVVLLLTAREL